VIDGIDGRSLRRTDPNMKCVETRRTTEGFRRRRYVTSYGTIRTIEIPESVFKALDQKKIKRRMAGWNRNQMWRLLCVMSMQHKQQGWKALASAHELGIDVRTVQRWWQQGGRKRAEVRQAL
jgi:hypothetical protein